MVPVYNEAENVKLLVHKLQESLNNINYEIIFVDDGSNDNTIQEIIDIKAFNISVIAFTRNFGQTSALAAGIEYTRGEYIATLDGDLQNDPSDILIMLDYLIRNKLDIVAGRRLNRQDNYLRNIPSKIANYLIRKLTKVEIQDYGCTLKVFKASIAKNLDLYGELHRFIPILAELQGAKIGEIGVKHHPRIYGTSKYGLNRTIKVISDLLLMYFFQKYKQKPMHLFGNLGIIMFMIGGVIELYLLCMKFLGENIGTRPLFYVGILFLIASIQFITTGFLAELMMRTYYSVGNKKPYSIEHIYKNDQNNE
ncbi:Undecaprenyl-phosphate 4-deoxy-4-formamido-L-arabinose transferase [Rickettsiales bacterium Ac37b]|nr:Undecaprenyl-phosphate 4-deoxy-4-formamido-L-arabinose transferase [Rickettsiales bacterium Ac37b]